MSVALGWSITQCSSAAEIGDSLDWKVCVVCMHSAMLEFIVAYCMRTCLRALSADRRCCLASCECPEKAAVFMYLHACIQE